VYTQIPTPIKQVDEQIWSLIRNVTDGHKPNPNGCPLSATFFVSAKWTNYWQIQQLYGQGHEIATHTFNHVSPQPANEITSAQRAFSAFGGVPSSKINGFRTPFLAYNSATYQTLKDSNLFKYDSSMPVDYTLAPYVFFSRRDFRPIS
jgi:peptidoglycan/xylan/chitin deacetylase (PgdA/CDA1 family)